MVADVENDEYIRLPEPTTEVEIFSRYPTHIYKERRYRIIKETAAIDKGIFYFAEIKNNSFLSNIVKNIVGIKWALHREDGPAHIETDPHSGANNKYYYLEGWEYYKEDWFALLTPEQKQYAVWNL